MRKDLHFTAFLLVIALCQHSLGDDEAIKAAFDELVAADHWRDRTAATERLAQLGDRALSTILEGTNHKDHQVRKHCYRVLQGRYLSDARSFAAFIRGLEDPHHWIAYSCAFWLGRIGNDDAEEPLREVMKEPTSSHLRYAAAKSLAELGRKDVIVTLYNGLGSDRYMPRSLCNMGIKALTGKNLNDFDYDYSEDACVSAGVESRVVRRPIRDAELKASRFRAIAAYCQWLKNEMPEVYRLLDVASQ